MNLIRGNRFASPPLLSMFKPVESLADFLTTALSPLLIGLLVGSVVCFLVEACYPTGDFNGRLQFILCLFVMGAVCIARIAVEQGGSFASLYALPLGIVTALAMMRFVVFSGPLAALGPLIGIGLMLAIWWGTHRLTIDSTLIDRDADRSDAGLLTQIGLKLSAANDAAANPSSESAMIQDAVSDRATGEPSSKVATGQPFDKLLRWWNNYRSRPHAPGTWAFYSALGALPVFGLGQWFLPGGDLSLRRWTWLLLVIYIGAALGLLLTTSFLGMRRYLRQRKLELPVEMAAGWLMIGGVLIGGLMVVAFLLPRPAPEYSLAHWLPTSATKHWQPSSWGQGRSGVRDEQGRSGDARGKAADNQQGGTAQGTMAQSGKDGNASNAGKAQPGGNDGRSGQDGQGSPGQQGSSSAKTSQPGQDSSGGDRGQSSQQSSDQDQNQPRGDNKTSEQQAKGADTTNSNAPSSSTQQNATPSNPHQSSSAPQPQLQLQPFLPFPDLLNYAGLLLVAVVAAFFAWRHRAQWQSFWQQLQREWADLWARLFGRPVKTPTETSLAAPLPRPQSFADFADPFQSGQASRWSLAELMGYSFRALEAWGRDRQCHRDEGQTPGEFADRLAQREPRIATEARQLAAAYGLVAYGGGAAAGPARDIAQRCWQRLREGTRLPKTNE